MACSITSRCCTLCEPERRAEGFWAVSAWGAGTHQKFGLNGPREVSETTSRWKASTTTSRPNGTCTSLAMVSVVCEALTAGSDVLDPSEDLSSNEYLSRAAWGPRGRSSMAKS